MTDSPIYEQLTGELLLDPAPTVPELDAQSRAYREMPAADVVTDDDIELLAIRTHPPLEDGLGDTCWTVEQYELQGWDTGREDPR